VPPEPEDEIEELYHSIGTFSIKEGRTRITSGETDIDKILNSIRIFNRGSLKWTSNSESKQKYSISLSDKRKMLIDEIKDETVWIRLNIVNDGIKIVDNRESKKKRESSGKVCKRGSPLENIFAYFGMNYTDDSSCEDFLEYAENNGLVLYS